MGSGSKLTHLDDRGQASMVDIADKAPSAREARAGALLEMAPATLQAIYAGATKKGDVLATARIAGIQAAKQTPSLIPLCHQIALTSVEVSFQRVQDALQIEAIARCTDRTGVEMEALTAVAIAALTVYDMVKGIDRGMVIKDIKLLEKRGGRSGHWSAPGRQ